MAAREKRESFQPRVALGAVLYLRVSTSRQLKGEVSIPSQRKACTLLSDRMGKAVVDEYVDGASGTDDARPSFQRMISLAKDPNRTFDTIIVYSLSRFYRSGPEMELLIRALHKKGVQVISSTQPIHDDPARSIMRQIIGIFDEHTSIENSKNVRRSMRENALQGFWNGTTPPLGYRTVEVERRGTKIKKKLEIDPVEAELVIRMYDLYLNGSPTGETLGVKNVVKHLNENGFRTRLGALFGVGQVHKILTASYYATGVYRWGVTNSKTREMNDPDQSWRSQSRRSSGKPRSNAYS